MADSASPDNIEWLIQLVGHSPLLPDPALRHHWQQLIPWLGTSARYVLAAVLLDIQYLCTD